MKGKEFDIIIDCSGNGPAIEATIPFLARNGRYGIFGITSPETKVSIKPYDVTIYNYYSSLALLITQVQLNDYAIFQMYKKELLICGMNINPYTFPKAIGLLQAMNNTYLNLDKLGIGVYKLSQYKEALETLQRGEISKAMFKM